MKTFLASLATLLLATVAYGQTVWIEAESGMLASEVPVIVDTSASGGSYVHVPPEAGALRNQPMMTYTFTVPEDGTYALWARVRMPNRVANPLPAYNAVYIAVNGNTPTTFLDEAYETIWDFVDDTPAVWTWDVAYHRGDAHANRVGQMLFALTAGTHTLEVGNRDIWLDIDAFMLTKDMAFIPSGVVPVPDPVEDPTDSITLIFTYTEPSDNQDGSSLVDLASCTIKWTMDGVEQPAETIPASTPEGGAVRSTTVPTLFDRTADRTVVAMANCKDTADNVSVDSEPVTLVIPAIEVVDTLAPGTIDSLSVTATFN